ncbi:MAG: hypothetical protein Q9227_005901 [Pyrenula ochraceoflavens]
MAHATQLIKLPDEIQLAVIRYLQTQRSTPEEGAAQESVASNHDDALISPLLALSSTCKLYRALLIPHIFRSIVLRENAKSGEAIEKLLDGGYGQHVRELRFVAHADDPGDEIEGWETEVVGWETEVGGINTDLRSEDNEEQAGDGTGEETAVPEDGQGIGSEENQGNGESANEAEKAKGDDAAINEGQAGDEDGEKSDNESSEEEAEELMSAESYAVLSNLKSFPHLHTLVLYFDMDLPNWDESVHVLMNPESSSDIRRREERQRWRMLLRKTFAALAENGPGCCQTFKIRNLVPKLVSVWRTDSWKRFLGELRDVDISIMGGDDGAGWNINTQYGYSGFIGKLARDIFNHLHKTTSLTISPHLSGPLGGDVDDNFCKLPLTRLTPSSSPSLKRLSLKHLFIDQALAEYLTAHPLLEYIELNSCYAFPTEYTKDPFPWSRFFTSLASAHLPNLQKFLISELEEDYSFEQSSDGKIVPCEIPIKATWTKDQPDSEEVIAVRQALQEERKMHGKKGKRLFSYRTVLTEYGNADPDDYANRAMFWKGEDWAAYLKVLKKVERNKERMREEKVEREMKKGLDDSCLSMN